jgi:hypothetical protein
VSRAGVKTHETSNAQLQGNCRSKNGHLQFRITASARGEPLNILEHAAAFARSWDLNRILFEFVSFRAAR